MIEQDDYDYKAEQAKVEYADELRRDPRGACTTCCGRWRCDECGEVVANE